MSNHFPVGKIQLVWVDRYGSDWVAIYRDGRKVYEGHPPDFDEAFLLLNIDHDDLKVPSEAVAGRKRLPDNLADVETESAS